MIGELFILALTFIQAQIGAGAGDLDGIGNGVHRLVPIGIVDVQLAQTEHLIHINMSLLVDPKRMVNQSHDLNGCPIRPTGDAAIDQLFGRLDPFIEMAVLTDREPHHMLAIKAGQLHIALGPTELDAVLQGTQVNERRDFPHGGGLKLGDRLAQSLTLGDDAVHQVIPDLVDWSNQLNGLREQRAKL